MAKARISAGLLASCLLVGGSVASAAPTVTQMLSFRPKQEGVVYTTPTAQEQDSCKVELEKARVGRGSGWLLKDGKGNTLRRFFDTNGDNRIDIWSYYLNGAEVYRETDINFNDKADHYRWLNAGGTKWGLDLNEDGKIDTWKQISAEEVSQEILQAVAKKDYSRLQALMLTDADFKALDLTPAERARVQESTRKSPTKFQAVAAKLAPVADKVRWIYLETDTPQCVPAETNGSRQDVTKYLQCAIVFEANDKADRLLTGEMFLVGQAWKVIDAPTPDDGTTPIGGTASKGPEIKPGDEVPAALKPLFDKLHDLDRQQPTPSTAQALVARYNVQRADILEQIAAQVKAEDREKWQKQIADCLSQAVQNNSSGEKGAYERLARLKAQVVRDQPGSPLAAHVVSCELISDYSIKLATEKDITKVQKDWLEKLAAFVKDYPRSEDTPDALMQLGMVNELMGEEGPAKKWYELMVKEFPNHPQARKAAGAIRRLGLDGKELQLAGNALGTNVPYDIRTHHGKITVVYYCARWNGQCTSDFTKLKTLLSTYAAKGLEVVCVNLDNTAREASDFQREQTPPGIVLYEEGGMSGKLGENYGIMVLPTLFLVDKDGKVASRTVQMTTLEDELKKLLK